jgi:hypothetical protein
LSGLPLALELAASGSYRHSFAEIAFELERSFDSLAAPLYDLPPRHRSLRAVFDQSWRLLSPVEREVIQALAVFRGGFDLTAAERVAEASSMMVLALRDKSLLQDAADGRFVIHELFRQYAEEQRRLASAADRVCERHSAFYREQSALAELYLVGVDHAQWMSRLDIDLDNLRFALQWSIMAQPEAALEIAAGLWRYWQWRGYLTEGRWWLEQALNATEDGECARARAKALAGAAHLAWSQGDFVAARQWAEQSVLLWQTLTDWQGLAHALIVLGIAVGALGDHVGAASVLEESISLCRTNDDCWGLAMALFYLADGYNVPQMAATAKAQLCESLTMFESLSDQCGVALATYGLGVWAYRTGDYAMARTRLERALLTCQELRNRWLMAQVLSSLAELSRSEEQISQAERLFIESLALYREMGARGREAMLLHCMGYVSLQQSESQRAAGYAIPVEAMSLVLPVR